MEVTNKSFQEKLPSIVEAINSCDFYAVDTEFSGFSLNLRDRGHVYDTMEDRYQKLKFVCQNYLAWQLGLSTFKYDPLTNKYQCRTYTFPVFPRDSPISKRSYLMSSTSLKFLAMHHFPFSRMIDEGIGFQQLSKESKVMEDVDRVLVKEEVPPILKIAPGKETKLELNKIQERISAWLPIESDSIEIQYSSPFVRDYFLKSEFYKRIGSAGISKAKVEALSTVFTKNKNYKRNLKNQQKAQKQTAKVMQKDFRAKEGAADEDMKVKLHKEEMGISLVVSALIRCKKPMVGHNFIYDVGFLYHQFIDDLPENYELFKKRVHDCFPEIYDTKIIARAHNGNYPHYDLEHVLRRSRELNKDVVKFFFPPEFRNLEEVKEGHDAGFDAFCAGKAFAIMANLIKLRVIKGNVFYKGAEVLEELAKGVKKEVEEKKEVNLKEEKKETNIKEVEGKEQNEAKTKLAAMLAGFKHGPAAMANSKKP